MEKNILKAMWSLLVLVLVAATCQSATIPVSGGTGLQAAIDGANPGDTIEITDSMTYAEDIFLNQDGLVLRGAAGQRPTISAQNNTGNRGLIGDFIALADTVLSGPPAGNPDQCGLLIEADNVTVQNLNIQNLTAVGSANVINLSSAIYPIGAGITIQDCSITGSPTDPDNTNNLMTLGLGDLTAFTGSTGLAAKTATGLEVINCDFAGARTGIDASDFGAELSDPSLAGPAQVRLPPSATFTDCSLVGFRRCLQGSAWGNVTFNNFYLESNSALGSGADCLRLQGGALLTFNGCEIQAVNNRALNIQVIPASGGEFMNLVFSDCVICGGGWGGEMNLIDDANVSLSECVIRAEDNTSIVFLRRPDGFSGISNAFSNFTGHASRPAAPASVNFIMDHCDLINLSPASVPFRVGIAYSELAPSRGVITNNLTVTNSNFVNDTAIFDGTQQIIPAGLNALVGNNPYHNDDAVVTLDNNNFVTVNPSANALRVVVSSSGNGNTVAGNPPINTPAFSPSGLVGPTDPADFGSNLVDVTPNYLNILGCAREDFIYLSEVLAHADSSGGAIGSQGAPPEPTSGVETWNLYR